MSEKYLNLNELREKLGNRSRAAIYLDVKFGRLPKPTKLGGRIYWPESLIDGLMTSLRSGGAR